MKRLLAGVCTWLVLSGALVAADGEAPKIDPQADKVLHALSDYIAKAKMFSVDVDANITIQPVNQVNSIVSSLVVDRGGRLAARLKDGVQGITMINDGKQLTVAVPTLKKYTVQEAPKSIGEPLPQMLTGLLTMQGLQFVAPLWNDKPYDALIEGVKEIKYVGEEEVEGTKCHHLKFIQQPCDVELWVAAGDKPELRKLGPDMMTMLKEGGAALPPGISLNMSIEFAKWDLNPKVTDDTFAFVPDPSFDKVESLFGRQPTGPHPLEDKPAPLFELALLDGGKVSLDQHKSKEIVVLDFWATWCGPCVQALPTIAEVTSSLKAKGVAFYAVNLEEEPEQINAFLAEKKLKVPVALDKDGSVAGKYLVEGIPQTVIIDKQGSVRVVHIGASPNLKQELTDELEALLAGKKPGKADDK